MSDLSPYEDMPMYPEGFSTAPLTYVASALAEVHARPPCRMGDRMLNAWEDARVRDYLDEAADRLAHRFAPWAT